MPEPSAYKQIVAYIDQLHQDLGQLVVLLEGLMEEEGYVTVPRFGNKACWHVSSHYAYSNKWRVPYVARCYLPDVEGERRSEATRFYLADLAPDTSFEFPALLCGILQHDPLTDGEVSSSVFITAPVRSLTRDGSEWTHFPERSGWYRAKPAFKSPVHSIQGYVLNLFDLVDRQHVIDNILKPLVTPDDALDAMLTVRKHPFGGR